MALLSWFSKRRDARNGLIVTVSELRTLERSALERRALALARTTWLGDNTVLCRILGRFKFFVRAGDDGFGAHIMLDGVWESWLTVFMARRIKAGMNVVDVGANHGYYTVLFAALVGGAGRVAAIEPHPEIAALLRRSVQVNGYADRTCIIQQAAGDVDGRKVILSAPEHESKNAHILPKGAEGGEGRFRIRVAKVDTLLADWPRIDFLKIDVEGAEEAAVAGMMTILRRDRPQMLLEFNAGRCVNPATLLDELHSVYGQFLSVGLDGELSAVEREPLLDLSRTEDWMLYFGNAPQ